MIVKVIGVVEGTTGLVDAVHLEYLIKSGKISAFKRSRGWVKIDKGPIRQDSLDFSGPDRRKIEQYPR
jgi:hypothetical protein